MHRFQTSTCVPSSLTSSVYESWDPQIDWTLPPKPEWNRPQALIHMKLVFLIPLKDGCGTSVKYCRSLARCWWCPEIKVISHKSAYEWWWAARNDLDSDYNYYKGLNYTSSQTGTLPTGVNQNIYNDTTLAKVYIQYNASDISDSTMTGYISLDEQQSKRKHNGYTNWDRCRTVGDGLGMTNEDLRRPLQ